MVTQKGAKAPFLCQKYHNKIECSKLAKLKRRFMNYLWLKALHIIFMVSWFAGIFYLPRIFVNLAMAKSDETYQHLLLMANKLYRFVTPFMFLTVGFGGWLLFQNPNLLELNWFLLKLTLVVSLIIYHFVCGNYLAKLKDKEQIKSHVFYRWFNEFPVLILFSVIILVVVKPF